MMLKKFPRKLIGEILIEEGFLDTKDLDVALRKQKQEGGLIGDILVKMGAIGEDELIVGLSKQLSLPFIRLGRYNVNRGSVKLIPKELAERYGLFAFEHSQGEVSVAMSDPLNEQAIEEIKKRAALEVQVFLAAPSEIREAIGVYYGEVEGRKAPA